MRRTFNEGQEVVFQDFDRISLAVMRTLNDRILFEMLQKKENAFFGDGMKVSYVGATSVSVAAGLGFQTDGTQTSPTPTKRLLYRGSSTSLNLEAPDASDDRIDIVCVRFAEVTEISENRKFKDATDSSISTQLFAVQKDEQAEFLVVAGTPDASPVAPSTPSGYIKIATLLVTAVSGLAGSGAVTDNRSVMPVGPELLLNTTGFNRLTAGATTALKTLIADIDALLHRGYFNYLDVDEVDSPAAEPGSPSADRQRLFYRDGVLYLKNSSGVKTPVGSGGGGGGGAVWKPSEAVGSIAEFEFGNEIHKFTPSEGQKSVIWIKVPDTYVAGRQINASFNAYSPGTSGTWLLQTVATLIRTGTDAVSSTTNQRTSGNTAVTNDATANKLKAVIADITSSSGQINSVGVQPGDLIKIEISRPSGTDTEDTRFIPSSTEFKF